MEKAQVYAKHKSARVSPKKVAIVMDMVRGKSLEDAKKILSFDSTKGAKILLKVLKSAEANSVNNNNLKPEDLYVAQVYVDGGRMQKGGRAGSKGRNNPLLKRYSHLTIGLSEKPEVKQEKKVIKEKKSKKVSKEKK